MRAGRVRGEGSRERRNRRGKGERGTKCVTLGEGRGQRERGKEVPVRESNTSHRIRELRRPD